MCNVGISSVTTGPGQSQVVRIGDVAARAGVALSSVSRVLSGHPDVSPSMRERVAQAAAELGYEPNVLAQSLRRGTTHTIGFVLRDISNPLFANIARRCEQELRRAGYSMLITSSDGDIAVEAANLTMLRRRRVDGLIASLVSESGTTERVLSEFTIPIVLLDRDVEGLTASRLLCDHADGVYNAVTAALARGHVRVALISGGLDVRSSRERRRGYEAAHEEVGVEIDHDLLAFGGFDAAFAHSSTLRLLTRAAPPTAVLAGGVATTAGVLQAMKNLRLKPGLDVALVALDEWPMFDIFTPHLASVSRDSDEMGSEAARMMIEMLHGVPPHTVTLETTFHIRDSLGPPNAGVLPRCPPISDHPTGPVVQSMKGGPGR